MNLTDRILEITREHVRSKPDKAWRPGVDLIPYANCLLGEEEIASLVAQALRGWLTLGERGDEFEALLKKACGVRDAVFVNSGSSANLIAVSALRSEMVDRPLSAGQEVIVPATSFPTTVGPIVQNGLVPVFVDCEVGTYNADPKAVESAIGPRTRAIMMSHTLGNPFNLDHVMDLVEKFDLHLIEDCCDALGSTWNGRPVGSFGDFGTLSFYPSHHITTGEGGAVLTSKARYAKAARTFRDWGRDCWCATGVSNTCQKRFGWKLGDLPEGYDHKYIYSEIGYNMKPTDLQAAVGVAQIQRLHTFCEKRKKNFFTLYSGLDGLPGLALPKCDKRADVSWFAFPMTVLPGAKFTRRELVAHLESRKIDTRMLFAGNIIRQPAFSRIQCRKVGGLENSDLVMNGTFMIGLHPGIRQDMLTFMIDEVRRFVTSRS